VHCDATIALDDEGDYNPTKWEEHKANCPRSVRFASPVIKLCLTWDMIVLRTTSKLLCRRMRLLQRPPMLAPAVLRGRRIAPHYLWLLQRQLLSTPLHWREQARNDCESRMKESRKQGLVLVLERTLYLHRLVLWTGSSSHSGVLLVDLGRVWDSRLPRLCRRRRQRNRHARDTFFKYFPIFFCFHEILVSFFGYRSRTHLLRTFVQYRHVLRSLGTISL
jgi:hypothetical protein